MFERTGRNILIGVVTSTLLSTATTPAFAQRQTHHLMDSEGNPIMTTREDECVVTPETPNIPSKLFRKCGDIIDTDKDGIMDDEDVCPHNTPAEISRGVYQSGSRKGCPLDSDNDGVPDYRDDCPNNTPLEVSKGVDLRGCPLDTDQDGVPDYKDLCPGTSYGVEVDEHGCALIDDSEFIVLAGDVTFAFDSDDLTPQARTTLDELVSRITIRLVQDMEVVGYTDSVGGESYNQGLSERRAASVANYLIARGVPYDKITQRGEGEFAPVAPNDTRIGRAKNRRVEIKVRQFRNRQ